MDGDEELFGKLQHDYDAFFAAESPSEAAAVAAAALGADAKRGPAPSSREGDAADIESEYALLSQHARPSSPAAKRGSSQPKQRDAPPASPEPASGPVSFAMDDGSDDGDMDMVQSEYTQDCRPPEIPTPPADFTAEDLTLREALIDFYLRHRADNLSNIDNFVKQYRGRNVSHLWAQLGVKYKMPASDVVEMLARTLYISAAFEYADDPNDAQPGGRVDELEAALASASCAAEYEELLLASFEAGTVGGLGLGLAAAASSPASPASSSSGSEWPLRMLCFRGLLEHAEELRPKAWKVLLAYLPLNRRAEWTSIEAEKRALYATYRNELLVITGNHRLEVKAQGSQLTEALETLQQIQKDVERTRQDSDYFRSPAARCALSSMLFVYARRNPDIRYVQGMNELAAIIFYVMSVDPDAAEAEAYWCFSQLMTEIKPGFLHALDKSREGLHPQVASTDRFLRLYDPELAKHLQKHGSPHAVLGFRWCSLLFAQDVSLPGVVRLWDVFLADAERFDLVPLFCLAVCLSSREALLRARDEQELADVLRAALRNADVEALRRRMWAICALERRRQAPPFPPRGASLVIGEISLLAQGAAARAQEVASEAARTFQQKLPPAVRESVRETAGQAAGAAVPVLAGVAIGGAQAVQGWLEDSGPGRREALGRASTTAKAGLASFWQSVKATGAAAAEKAAAAASAAAAAAQSAAEAAAERAAEREKAAGPSSALGSSASSRSLDPTMYHGYGVM